VPEHVLDDPNIILQVRVDGDDNVTLRVMQTGQQGGLMTLVSRQLDAMDTWVSPSEIRDEFPRLVGAPVIDEIDGTLGRRDPASLESREGLEKPATGLGQYILLVVTGDDQRDPDHDARS
jgi:hypothetical protein